MGQRAPDFYVDPADRERLLARVREEGRVHGFEAMLKRTSGREFPALLSAQPLVFEGEPALLVSAVDITTQKAIEGQLRILATRDALTDCLNRRHFLETASAEIERAVRYRHPVSVAMLDADRFKDINDTFGHEVGDQALRAIADAGRGTLRKTDIFGRLGGEEFAILLVETGLGEAESVIGRVVAAIAGIVIEKNGARVPVRVSAGVAERRENERLTPLLRRADQALYEAKQAGRDRIVVSDTFALTDEHDEFPAMRIADERCEVRPGTAPDPDLTIRMPALLGHFITASTCLPLRSERPRGIQDAPAKGRAAV